MRKKSFLAHFLVAALLILSIIPAYLRAYAVAGDSDAPAYVTGDRVIVNLAAYDLRLPYTGRRLLHLTDPAPGDVVLFRHRDGTLLFKRVAAGPGSRIALSENHLIIDGRPLRYTAVALAAAGVTGLQAGEVVERESGHGPARQVIFTPGRGEARNMPERRLGGDGYFLLGSNRDHSLDSRHFGAVPRASILGKVIGAF